MMLAILAYSLTTALSAAAWNWQSFAVLRFLVLRGAGIGSLLASGVWLLIGGLGPGAWRWMYLVGVLPALLVLWIRRGMPESARWEEASERRRAAHAQRRSGAVLEGEGAALTRFTVTDMFLDRSARRRLIPAF
jgi:hypothetical protein